MPSGNTRTASQRPGKPKPGSSRPARTRPRQCGSWPSASWVTEPGLPESGTSAPCCRPRAHGCPKSGDDDQDKLLSTSARQLLGPARTVEQALADAADERRRCRQGKRDRCRQGSGQALACGKGARRGGGQARHGPEAARCRPGQIRPRPDGPPRPGPRPDSRQHAGHHLLATSTQRSRSSPNGAASWMPAVRTANRATRELEKLAATQRQGSTSGAAGKSPARSRH